MNAFRFFRRVLFCGCIGMFLVGGIAYKAIRNTTLRHYQSQERLDKLEADRAYLQSTFNAKPVQFTTDDGIDISGLFIERPHAQQVILLCHGYGMSKEYMKRFVNLFPDDSLLLFDFRAHGQSGGNLISIGYYEQRDVRAAIQFLQENPSTAQLPVIGVGLSMGGAALLGAGANGLPFKALIIDSTFANLYDQISNSFDRYTGLPRTVFMPLMLRMYAYMASCQAEDIVPAKFITNITCPVLLIYSRDDDMTPISAAHALYAAARSPVELWVVGNSKHGFILRDHPEEYTKKVQEFLARHK